MKKNEKKDEKIRSSKGKTLVVSIISLLTIMGGTLAYFTTSTSFTNTFKAGKYQNQIVEEFTAPTNWTPGTTTSKTVKITNNGTINMAVRASYTEKWTDANGNELPLKDSNNNVAAIINFNSGWTKDNDGYYYYGSKTNKTVLQPNETSSSFINSVTFNSNITATLNKTQSADGKTITYTSTGSGYDGGSYILIIKLETIQYDQANNLW